MTIEKLKAYGANTDEGLARCLNDEGFYLMLVGSALTDEQIQQLRSQIEAGDLAAAFETAHALKGVYANLSLTPLYEAVFQLTEHLRAREEMDYTPLVDKLSARMKELIELGE